MGMLIQLTHGENPFMVYQVIIYILNILLFYVHLCIYTYTYSWRTVNAPPKKARTKKSIAGTVTSTEP